MPVPLGAAEREPVRIAKLQAESEQLQPLLQEVYAILPGNELERQHSLLQLKDNMRGNEGFVLEQSGRVLALLLYYLKGSTCRVVFAYALKQQEPALLLHHLLSGLVTLARDDQCIDSIRFDMVPWFPESIREAFVSCGFSRVERMLMRRQDRLPTEAAALPHGIRLVPWDTWLTQPAAEMLYLVFGNGYEAKWDRSLAEISGCRHFISDCYSGRFGIFDPRVSFALQYQNLWVGLATATWNGGGEGFIPAFGLLPNFVGQGLGHIMLNLLLYRYGCATFPPSAIELAVSEENRAAVQLYHKHDFKLKSRFQVYYLHL